MHQMGPQAQREILHTQITMEKKIQVVFSPACSVAGVRERLAHYALTPNKALGQNFLVDEEVLYCMLARLPHPGLPVLEIGPGLGALTQGLLSAGRRVVAIEKDAAMARILDETLLPQYPKMLHVLNEDFLHVSTDVLLSLLKGPFLVAANLPYYITTPILLSLLSSALPIPFLTLMLQREAAVRLFANPGERIYGPLTVLAQTQYAVERVIMPSPASFFPQPEVHSALVALDFNGMRCPAGFSQFLKDAFAMRRKTLLNTLTAAGRPAAQLTAALAALPAKPDVRAEALSPSELLRLFVRLGC